MGLRARPEGRVIGKKQATKTQSEHWHFHCCIFKTTKECIAPQLYISMSLCVLRTPNTCQNLLFKVFLMKNEEKEQKEKK